MLLTGPARGYVRRELERLGDPARARAARRRATSSRRAYHALDVCLVTSRQEGGPEGRARGDGGRRAARHDARRPGAGARRRRRERPARGRRRRGRARRPRCERVHDDAALRARLRAARPRRPRRRTPRSGSTRSGRELLEGFVQPCGLTARVGRYARGAGAGRACLRAAARRPGYASSTATTACPRPGEPVAGRHGEVPAPRAARSRTAPTDFTLLYLGSTWLPRDLRPLLRLARRRGIPVVVNQSGVAYPGWAGDATRTSSTGRSGARCSPPTTSSTRASSASARPTSSSASRAGSWEVLYNAVDVEHFTPGAAPPRTVRSCCSAATRRRRTGSSSRCARSRTCPEARLIVTGRLVSDPQPLLRELGIGDRVEFVGRYAQRDAPALFRRAHLLLHTKVQGSRARAR